MKWSESVVLCVFRCDSTYQDLSVFQVSEKICDPMKAMFSSSDARFIASGREDLDVRMLGEGRPFAVELRNSRFINSLKG